MELLNIDQLASLATSLLKDGPDTLLPRTVRYYVTVGAIPAPEYISTSQGREARYGKGHLIRILATKQLQAQGLPLSEIAKRLQESTDEDVLTLIPDVELPKIPTTTPAASFWDTPAASTNTVALSSVPTSLHALSSTSIDLAPGLTLTLSSTFSPPSSKALEELSNLIPAIIKSLEK